MDDTQHEQFGPQIQPAQNNKIEANFVQRTWTLGQVDTQEARHEMQLDEMNMAPNDAR